MEIYENVGKSIDKIGQARVVFLKSTPIPLTSAHLAIILQFQHRNLYQKHTPKVFPDNLFHTTPGWHIRFCDIPTLTRFTNV